MSSRRRRDRGISVALAVAGAVFVLGPISTLFVQAAADAWHGSAVVPQAFGMRGIRGALDNPLVPAAAANSLFVATATVLLALGLAWPAARALAADGRRSLQVALLVPLLVPPLAIGEGLTPWFLRAGIADTLTAIVLAHLVTVLPYVTLALVPGFTPGVLDGEHAAATLGAGRMHRLRNVTIPAVRRHLALAVALGFTVSWSQYGTSLVVGGGIPMLPVVLIPFVRSDPQIAAVLDLVFLAPPLALIALAAMTRQPGEHHDQAIPARSVERA
jgi:putative spermidine/putrescine transport system permease protein